MKREANAAENDAVLAATRGRPFVEVSTRDPWWGARPVADRYGGRNVLWRLWMELCQQLRDGDPASRSDAGLRRSARRPGSCLTAISPRGSVPLQTSVLRQNE